MGEPRESASVEPNSERQVGRNKCVNPHIELLAPDKQRVTDVPLDNVGLSLRALWLPSEIVLPLSYLGQFVEQKDALALALADRFHDPDR